jgi:hypothetical protein
MIENHPGGGMTITGGHIELYGMIVLKSSLKLQEKGLKFGRGPAASTIARTRYGLKGKIPKQIEQLEVLIEQFKAALDAAPVQEQP